MEQLVLELAPAGPPSFSNFVTGPNVEAVAALARLSTGAVAETGILLWGASGAGKSHLLRATVTAALAAGRTAACIADPGALSASVPEALARYSLVAVDAVDTADTDAQGRLFTLFNELRAAGGNLLAAAAVPLGSLRLREDLRTRLGWGLVFEVRPLGDADKGTALVGWARERGFGLADDVIGYLLAHGRRDMPSLLATLAALDRHSLATKRPVTVPLLRSWLQRDIRLGR